MPNNKNNILKQYKTSIIAFGIAFGLIIVGWMALYIYCEARSGSEYTYEFSADDTSVVQDGLSIDIATTKSWKDATFHENEPYGNQYDVTVHNDTEYDFISWRAHLIFSDGIVMDSAWNGDFDVDNNILNFVATSPVDVIVAENDQPFGAVIYTKWGTEITGCIISGYWDIDMVDTGWFWTLIELTFLVIIGAAFRIYNIFRQRYYNERISHDADIIEQSLKTLTQFIDAKDAYTKDHSVRVADYAREIGRRIGMTEEETKDLYYITLLHDCGKIAVPDEILKKEGALTPQEFAIVKTHTTKGNELLKKFTALPGIGDGAHYHHERYDGYGYPSGLEGEDIPLYARIICVADAYDAMSSNRCYRKALDEERILSELELNSGKQFDPKFVPIMVQMIRDGYTQKVREKYPTE